MPLRFCASPLSFDCLLRLVLRNWPGATASWRATCALGYRRCCSAPTLLSLWPVLVDGSASCLAALSTLRSRVRRSLCVWHTARGLPGLAISVACGDTPARSLASAAVPRDSTNAPSANREHNRQCLVPPTPANSPLKKIHYRHWHSAAALHSSAPPNPPAAAAAHYRWSPASRTAPQSNDLHSPPACPCSPA